MFQSFTGNSRKPRQVNLSGQDTPGRRNLTPAQKRDAAAPGGQAAIASAQAQRAQREQRRERTNAAILLQKSWRGLTSRLQTRRGWRTEWDQRELTRAWPRRARIGDLCPTAPAEYTGGTAYGSVEGCYEQMALLARFLDANLDMDRARLAYFGDCLKATWKSVPTMVGGDSETWQLYRLSKLTVEALALSTGETSDKLFLSKRILSLLLFLTRLIPKHVARNAGRYYAVLAGILSRNQLLPSRLQGRFEEALLALLTPVTVETPAAYLAFATDYLLEPEALSHIQMDKMVLPEFDFQRLTAALGRAIEQDESTRKRVLGGQDRALWLLAHLILLQQNSSGTYASSKISQQAGYINILSTFLASRVGDIKYRLDSVAEQAGVLLERKSRDPSEGHPSTALPPFVREQILTLLQRESIVGFMSQIEVIDQEQNARPEAAQALATYALTLTRVFPQKRVIDIRMLLYEGSTKLRTTTGTPAIVYFWQYSQATTVFQKILKDHRSAIPLLKPFLAVEKAATSRSLHGVGREWVMLLLFLELYSFAIKLMDDEEFLAGGRFGLTGSTGWGSKIRESSFPLEDVRTLVSFLKNLAFALYWKSKDLEDGDDAEDPTRLGDYFASPASNTVRRPPAKVEDTSQESARNQLRNLVTGLLRSIHQRDARRKFFEGGFWLIGSQDNASTFIPAVVAEEERRQEISDVEEEEDDDDEVEEFEDPNGSRPDYDSATWSSRNAASSAHQYRVLREQKQLRQMRQMEAIAPRLEILRNLPFFVTFETRVQIFRDFILRDQHRRRGGNVDPDAWRWSRSQLDPGMVRRHHADIEREQVFSSAFDQLYKLDDGLKEPLQITFIDRFGTQEAGIDGGGVMKEFLTSITKETFDPLNEEQLFAVNDQSLLYPNPGKLDSHIHLLRTGGRQDGSSDISAGVRDLLARYRFLGRIVGKCLYEGLLIDATFAGYFLLRWGLAGGTTHAARESGYQVTVDDLRDLDEDLYQGVLKLKHYDGDVEADFGLNFTVVDTFEVPAPTAEERSKVQIKSVTQPLRPDGANIPVTNRNRPLYISLLTDHRLRRQSLPQTQAFLSGLGEIIQPMWLSMFDQSELQRLVGGDSREIDVADLRANTVYSGLYAMASDEPWQGKPQEQPAEEHVSIQIFWHVLRNMDDADRRKVLKFVTSTPRAPLLGFSHLNPHFSIRDSGAPDEGRLPSTSTCVNLLKLPRYTSAETMKEKLLYAVNSGAGFDLS